MSKFSEEGKKAARAAAKRAAQAEMKASMCQGKVPFESYSLAVGVVNRHARTKRQRRSAYRCIACGKWHVGTDVGRVRRRKAIDLRKLKHDDE